MPHSPPDQVENKIQQKVTDIYLGCFCAVTSGNTLRRSFTSNVLKWNTWSPPPHPPYPPLLVICLRETPATSFQKFTQSLSLHVSSAAHTTPYKLLGFAERWRNENYKGVKVKLSFGIDPPVRDSRCIIFACD